MALPATGGEYSALLQPGIRETAVRKGIVTDVLIRDYNGASTDLSATSAGLTPDGYFSPFAVNGQLRDDLLVTAEGANLGFYHLGALAESGIRFSPNVDSEDTMIAQARRSVRVDITKEDVNVEFAAREGSPLVDYLRADKPLLSVPDIGTASYAVAAPAEGNVVERQIILLMFDGTHRAAMVLPRAMRVDVGETAWNKNDPDDLALTYRGLMCPFAAYPWLLLREGSGWRGLGGYPDFGATAPVATQTGATTATVAHAVPTSEGDNDPFTYEVEKNTGSVWSAATVASSTESGGNVTHSVTGLTTATAYTFRVTATGSNELSAVSEVSNEITTA